jgi:hypothetical protein
MGILHACVCFSTCHHGYLLNRLSFIEFGVNVSYRTIAQFSRNGLLQVIVHTPTFASSNGLMPLLCSVKSLLNETSLGQTN